MHTTPNISKLVQALLSAQAEIGNPHKDAFNPHHKSKFASLASYLDASKEPLRRHGLVVIQSITGEGENLGVETMLAHESGEHIITSIKAKTAVMKKDGNGGSFMAPADGQAIGSLTTYLRRYAIGALLNIVGEDDDDAETERKSTESFGTAVPAVAPRSYAAPSAVSAPAPRMASSGGAAQVPIEFGKHKGKTIGDVMLEPEGRSWIEWASKRELKLAPDGKPYKKDVMFSAACVEILSGSSKSNQPETMDDVPF